MLRDMLDRIERSESDERMERSDRQDLVDRKDFMERTDAGRDCWGWQGELVLGRYTLPEQEHCSTAEGGRNCCGCGCCCVSWESSVLDFRILPQQEHGSGLRDVLMFCCCEWAAPGLRIFPQQEHGSSLTVGLV